MRISKLTITTVLAMQWIIGSAAAAATPLMIGGNARDHSVLQAVSQEWVGHFESGDLEKLLALYDRDAVIMSAGRARVAGIAAIRAMFEALLAAQDKRIHIEIEETGIDHNVAWASVLAVIHYQKHGAAPRDYLSRTFIVYRRDRQGAWKILRDLDAPTPDANPLAAIRE